MGGKYEVRWKLNGRCPFWQRVFTNSLLKALWLYVVAVFKGNTRVDLEMHAWKECPENCKSHEWICDNNPANLIPLCAEHYDQAHRSPKNAEKAKGLQITHEAPRNDHSGHENCQYGEI